MTTFCLPIVVVNHAPSYSRYSCDFRLLRGASAPPRGWSVHLGGGEGVGPLFPKGCAAVAYCMWLPDFACCCSPPRGWAVVAFGLASTITGFQLGPWFAIRHPAFHQCSDPRGWAVSVGHNHRLRWWSEISLCVAHVAYRPFLPHLRPGLYLPFAECLISR